MQYRLDLFAVFIFLGIVQAVFLCVFFFSKENRKMKANIFHGLMLLSMALCLAEIFLMYTGYIAQCLYLVDFSEPFSFAIGPCFYLLVRSLIHGKVERKHYWHLAFVLVYSICVIPFLVQPEGVKYNSWIESYKPGLPFRDYTYDRGDGRTFWITDHHTLLTVISLALYSVLSLIEVVKAFRLRKESLLRPVNPVLRKLWRGVLQVISVIALMLVIKMLHENDTGDHWLAAYLSVTIYLTSFSVIGQSGFFKQPSLAEPQKYKSSVVTPDMHRGLLQKLAEVMAHEKPFLNSGFSLPDLAQRLGTTVHILSQVINEGLEKSFFEMTASYRVEEAKTLLKEQRNIKVEEIADRVGYSSKSSFNNAFKKITGKTPSEFRATIADRVD
jgi:AraC-like DNA-binding protein